MIALSPNPVDWALAVVLGIPCLIAAVAYIAVWAEERAKDREVSR